MNVIELKVNVDIDNEVQAKGLENFLQSLKTDAVSVATVEKKKSTNTRSVKKEEIPVEEIEVVEEEVLENKKSDAITIEQCRSMLSKKVGNHRENIKKKLTDLGANNLTNLDPEHYESFYEYLNDL